MSQLDAIVKETRAAFIIAKADGVMDAGEVIQIAHTLAMKLYNVAGPDMNEKKALLMHTLKKGLDDDGGVDMLIGMAGASTEIKEAFKSHLIGAASASVDLLLQAHQMMTKAVSWLPPWVWALVSGCTKSVGLSEKDQQLIRDALAFTVGPNAVTLVDTDVSGAVTTAEAEAGAEAASGAVSLVLPGTVVEPASQ